MRGYVAKRTALTVSSMVKNQISIAEAIAIGPARQDHAAKRLWIAAVARASSNGAKKLRATTGSTTATSERSIAEALVSQLARLERHASKTMTA